MGSDLTKDEAIKIIEDVVKKYTKDYELVLVKRKPKNRAVKTLIFALKVKADEFCEDLFSDFMKIDISGAGINVIENRTTKEIFLISADITGWDYNEY